MQRSKSCGLSLPIEIAELIDRQRRDVSRSRFVLRLLEKVLNDKNLLQQSGSEIGPLDQTGVVEIQPTGAENSNELL